MSCHINECLILLSPTQNSLNRPSSTTQSPDDLHRYILLEKKDLVNSFSLFAKIDAFVILFISMVGLDVSMNHIQSFIFESNVIDFFVHSFIIKGY